MSPLVFKLRLCLEVQSDELHGKRVSTRLCGVHTSVDGRQWGVRLQIRVTELGPHLTEGPLSASPGL